jgi:hypothetical protein
MLASNPNPAFVAPKHHKKRPHIIRKCFNYASSDKAELHNWIGWLLINNRKKRQRAFYKDMQNTMSAMVPAIIHHLNIHTMKVEATIEELTDLCSLSTISKAGNKSISRGSRFMKMLAEANIINADGVWDKHNQCWLPKFITVNPHFFEWIGIPYSDIEAAQAKLRRFVKLDYITASELEVLTPIEIRKKAKVAHIRHAFKHRKDNINRKKQARLHKKLNDKTTSQEINEVGQIILSEMSSYEKATVDLAELKLLINQRRKYLNKVASGYHPPPNKI